MPRDLITDLRVIDVGGAWATNKIQNKGSVLSAYMKNITQDQTPKAQQQEQKTEQRHGEKCRWKEKNNSKSPTLKHQQRIILSEYLLLMTINSDVSAKAKCLKQKNLLWSTHIVKTLTLRGLSTYAEAVATLVGSLKVAEGFVCCCCSSSVLSGSRKNAVKTDSHDIHAGLQSHRTLTSGSAPSPAELIKLKCLFCLVEAAQARKDMEGEDW